MTQQTQPDFRFITIRGPQRHRPRDVHVTNNPRAWGWLAEQGGEIRPLPAKDPTDCEVWAEKLLTADEPIKLSKQERKEAIDRVLEEQRGPEATANQLDMLCKIIGQAAGVSAGEYSSLAGRQFVLAIRNTAAMTPQEFDVLLSGRMYKNERKQLIDLLATVTVDDPEKWANGHFNGLLSQAIKLPDVQARLGEIDVNIAGVCANGAKLKQVDNCDLPPILQAVYETGAIQVVIDERANG